MEGPRSDRFFYIYITWGLFWCFVITPNRICQMIDSTLWFTFYQTKKKRSDSVLWQKPPHTNIEFKKAKWQHKNATKNFDYTMIADWLKTVSWSNDSHPNAVVKPVCDIPTLQLTSEAMQSKGHPFKTRGPKGHISCTWVQYATFFRNQPRRTFLLTDRPVKHKLGRGHWDLASCEVSLNSVQRFQRRSRKCLSQSEARAAILFFRSARKTQTW